MLLRTGYGLFIFFENFIYSFKNIFTVGQIRSHSPIVPILVYHLGFPED